MAESNLIFSSGFNYQKISKTGTANGSASFGTPTETAIPHDVGKRSNFRVWFKTSSSDIFPAHEGLREEFANFVPLPVHVKARIDENNLYVLCTRTQSGSDIPLTLYYRIYSDAS